jgi:CheY-like chemotaxis protein
MNSLEFVIKADGMTTAINPGVYMEPRRKEILCLCYDSNMLRVRRLLLEHFGYAVLATNSLEDAKAIVQDRCPDLLLMDNNDTGPDFERLAKQVKGSCPEVITVMLSSYYYSANNSDAIDRLISKDDGPDALLAQLEELLAGDGAESRTGKRASKPI